MFDLQGKTAMVTGAGSGIGAAIARIFADRGASVAAVDRDGDKAEEVAAAIRTRGGVAAAHVCDVSSETDVGALFQTLARSHPRVDILVNNAGIAHVGSVETTAPEDFDRLFRVNVLGVYLCARAVVPIMLRQGGG